MAGYIESVIENKILNTTISTPNITTSPIKSQGTSSSGVDDFLIWNIFQTTTSLLLAIVGIIGNFLIVATVAQNKKMQNLQNYFVFSLAITDLVTFMINLPLSLISKYMSWPFGEGTCKYVLPVSDAVTAVSILTLVAISIDRYLAVSTSLRKSASLLFGKFIIIGIWIFSYLMVGVPLVFTFEIIQDQRGWKYCHPIWKSVTIKLAYFSTRILVFYVIPSLLIYICYERVNKRLSQNLKFLQRSASGLGKMGRLKQHKKVIRMFFAIFLSFVICFLPLNIIALIVFIKEAAKWKYMTQLYELTVLFAICNSAGNPVILYMLSKAYCDSFRKYLPILRKLRLSRIKWINRHEDSEDLEELGDGDNAHEETEYYRHPKDENVAFVTKNRGFTTTTSIASSFKHNKNSIENPIEATNRNLLDLQENVSSRSSQTQDSIRNEKTRKP